MAKDPVKVTPDRKRGGFRIRYWDGGQVGLGRRRFERRATAEEAQTRAQELRAALRVATGPVPRAGVTVGEVCRDWVAAIRDTTKTGSLKGYRRDLNNYVIPVIGSRPAGTVGSGEFAAVVDGVVAKGLSAQTLDGVVRTLNTMTTWAEPRGLLPETAWGSDRHRRSIIAGAKRALARDTDELSVATVPTWADVERLAAELEQSWPEHGANFVYVLAGTGLRLSEALGLTVDDIDVVRGTVRVERQADRLAAWPAVSVPKTRASRREALAWQRVIPNLADALEHADEDGRLFPPVDVAKQRYWTNRLTELLKLSREAAGWPDTWPTHYLRHHYASYSLAPPPEGYGIPVAVVAASLGHASAQVTLSTYTQVTGDPAAIVRAATS